MVAEPRQHGFGNLDRQRRALGEIVGGIAHLVGQIAIRDDACDEAESERFAGVELDGPSASAL